MAEHQSQTRQSDMTDLAKANRELYEARVALGVAVGFIPAVRADEFHERVRTLLNGERDETWICVECGNRYTSDTGRCGQLQPFECHGMVVPLDRVA